MWSLNGSTCRSIRINVIRSLSSKGTKCPSEFSHVCSFSWSVPFLSTRLHTRRLSGIQTQTRSELWAKSGVSESRPKLNRRATSGSLPMSSALFLGEWILNQHFAYLSAVTIPLTTQQTLVNGQLYHEKSSPTLSFGGRWSMISISVTDDTTAKFNLRHCSVAHLMKSLMGSTSRPSAVGYASKERWIQPLCRNHLVIHTGNVGAYLRRWAPVLAKTDSTMRLC